MTNVDQTSPEPPGDHPLDPGCSGPVAMWQLNPQKVAELPPEGKMARETFDTPEHDVAVVGLLNPLCLTSEQTVLSHISDTFTLRLTIRLELSVEIESVIFFMKSI